MEDYERGEASKMEEYVRNGEQQLGDVLFKTK
jgi:hypothetical protein